MSEREGSALPAFVLVLEAPGFGWQEVGWEDGRCVAGRDRKSLREA